MANTLIPTTNGAIQDIFTFTIPRGVWSISYQVKVSPNSTETATLNGLQSRIALSSAINALTIYANNEDMPINRFFPTPASSLYSVTGSAIIANTVTNNVVSLESAIHWTAGTGQMRWRNGGGTYLMVTRIG